LPSLLALAVLGFAPAIAVDGAALAIPVSATDFTPAADAHLEVSGRRERRRPPAQPWVGIGIGAGFGVWAHPGRPASFMFGDHLELEFGHGGSSLRPRLSTLRMGETFIGGEIGALALHAFGDNPSEKGLVLGAEAAAAWSMVGRRVLVGPTVGWRGVFEGRLTTSVAYTPATYRSWDALSSPTVGMHIGFTLTSMNRGRFRAASRSASAP